MFYYGRKRMGGLPTVIVVCCWSHIVWGHAVKTIGAAQGKAGPIHTQAPSHDWPAKHARMKTREDKEQPGQQATRGSRSSQLSHSFFHPHHEVGAATVTCLLCALIPWSSFWLKRVCTITAIQEHCKEVAYPFGGKNRGTEPPSKDQNRISPCQTIYEGITLGQKILLYLNCPSSLWPKHKAHQETNQRLGP